MGEAFLNGRVVLHLGNCLDVLARLEDCSVDSCVTDPPYHLTSIVQRFGAEDAALPRFKTGAYGGRFKESNGGTGAAFARMSRGFMGKVWDGGAIAFEPATWRAVYRVLKPGGHLLAMGGTRTFHRLVCAIEDAGFEIRDTISWLYGSGFPKSHDVSKGIDRAAGAERGTAYKPNNGNAVYGQGMGGGEWNASSDPSVTDAARQWEGWGTALKPACELIVLARKPLSEGTVAANVLRWGTGAINVDGCRVEAAADYHELDVTQGGDHFSIGSNGKTRGTTFLPAGGRWPANVVHDGSDEVTAAFPDSDHARGNTAPEMKGSSDGQTVYGHYNHVERPANAGDSGSAARFFFQAKRSPIEQVVITWISESEPCQATLLVDTEQLLERAIVVSASVAANGWSTFLSGSSITALCRKASSCIIRTATNSTTESKIWNWLMRSLTNASIADVSYETENGGSPVAIADNGTQSLIITLGETVSLPGANRVMSGTRLKISVNVASDEQASSARFHYGSKADSDDRLGARHPTIKPLDLMQWLVRLVTPKGGTVLDPFAGTGTTGEAAFRERCNAVLIEAEPEYQADIRRRMALALAGPDERQRESIKAKNLPVDYGPLFGFPEAAE